VNDRSYVFRCGNATDLALTAICGSICCAVPCGIAIALCCHHRITFDDYVGHEFLKKMDIASDPHSFSLLVKLTGWAVCAVTDTPKGAERFGFRSAEESIRFGWKCKRVLDLGRVFFLREIFPLSWDIALCPYVAESISLENLLLVAFPKKDVDIE
jgi:tRNA:m4X modification enzyme